MSHPTRYDPFLPDQVSDLFRGLFRPPLSLPSGEERPAERRTGGRASSRARPASACARQHTATVRTNAPE
jgi:hypothetical protein